MRPNRLLRVAGHCVIPALLLLPQAAPAAGGGLVETFNAICTDTFPSFQAMGDKVEALGGRLEPAAEPLYSRVPFVVPNSAKQGSTDQRHTNPLDDMGVDYAEGVVFDLPAAGCSVSRRGGVDEAAIAQLFNRFETATFLGDQKGTFTSGPYRAWLVRLSGGRAVLTIAEPQFAGKTMGVMFALVRLDETLLDQLTPRLRRDTPSRRPYGSKNFRGFDPVKDALRAPPAAVVDP
jgi:hypothetical protein